jgi:alpha-glucosidase (family GH31 glycosyl hydrolase)
MKQQSALSILALKHQPYGEHHPYLPLPYERFPRDPSEGELVTLGIETGHNPSAESVWCIWQIDGNSTENRTDAVKISTGETSDLWQVHLPAFNGYEIVHYRLFARNAEQQVESEEFVFSVLTWVDVVAIASVEEDTERMVVKLATTRPDLYIRLHAELDPTGAVNLRLSPSNAIGLVPSMPALKDHLRLKLGDASITLHSNPLRLELRREIDSLILKTIEPIRILARADGTLLQYKFGLESPADEAFYGFGERFNALDQRGNHLDNYVYGQYTGQGKRSYIPIPFFISSRGYGYWLKTECQAEFDLATAKSDCWTVTGHAGDDAASLDMRFFLQANPRAIVQAFTDLTGKPKLPPSWAFGLWMSSNDWNSQAEISRQLRLMEEHQIPATVLVIEAWSDEINFYIWNDARYQQKNPSQAYSLTDFSFPAEGRWPDPKAMADELHRADVRLVLWQNPIIKHGEARENLDDRLNKADQEYAIQHGYVVQRADGSPHRVEAHMPWFAGSLVFDFTNPQAADWWFKKREYLLTEIGVDGFKTDGGEHIWDPETHFFNSMRGSRGINIYPMAYESAYQRFLTAYRGEDHVLFSRAGYTGIQQVPCHWAGDENSTWEAFRASLRAMLNVGLCGVPFMGWDIAGFAGSIPSSELYLRATAFSVFCPIMQYHSDGNGRRIPSRDRTPWNIQEQTGDPDVIPIFRQFTNLRMNLIPYILGQAWESGQTGLPLMRPLLLDYPTDVTCRDFPYQYMFGDALLVAPVMEEGVSNWPVYLPVGEWRDLWTGKIYSGPATVEVGVPSNRIPVFQKKGSILPLHLDESGELGSPVGNSTEMCKYITLRIFPGGKIETPIFPTSGADPAWITVETSEEKDTLGVQLPTLTQEVELVIFANEPTSIAVDGQPLPRADAENLKRSVPGWQWNSRKSEIRIHLPEFTHAARVTVQ